MFGVGEKVWLSHSHYGPWPGRVVDVVECLRQNHFFLLYEVVLFGSGRPHSPQEGRLFAEESALRPLSAAVEARPSVELQAALALAKRCAKRLTGKKLGRNSAARDPLVQETEQEGSSTEAQVTTDGADCGSVAADVPWEERKEAVNMLYRLLKPKLPRGEAQD